MTILVLFSYADYVSLEWSMDFEHVLQSPINPSLLILVSVFRPTPNHATTQGHFTHETESP